MSQHPRHQFVPPNYIASTMLSNIRGAAPQTMYNQLPYNVAAVPSSQFIPSSAVYPSQFPDISSRMGIRPGMSHVFVPFQQQPAPPFTGVTRQRLPTDPAKLVEEQRKFQRERNFQIQQQRLKQFTIAGKKGSVNADNLLDSMFGKPDSKKHASKPCQLEQNCVTSGCTDQANQSLPVFKSSVVIVNQDDFPKSSRSNSKGKAERNPKDLENMMMKCSDFSGPQKAKVFHKPTVKEVPRSSHYGKTFAASEKAIDWNAIQGLDNVFIVSKPRFPVWCKREYVPPLFLQIHDLTSGGGQNSPDTSLLYSILISSGLQQGILGEIWDMVNLTAPGFLTEEEMFAALALVAVAQAGHAIKDISILHQLPCCPVPQLQYFNSPTNQEAVPATDDSSVNQRAENDTNVSRRPTSMPEFKDTVEKDMRAWKPFDDAEEKKEEVDDDFDDFKSATPMALNAPPLKEITAASSDDDFGDFKQALETKSESCAASSTTDSPAKESDLMLPEDRYSVFRSMQNNTPDSETCALTSESQDLEVKPLSSPVLSKAPNQLLLEDQDICVTNDVHSKISQIEDDGFGDFLDATVASTPPPNHPSACSNIQLTFTPDFADFSQLATDDPHAAVEEAEDFGDFATFQQHEQKLTIGHDCFSAFNRDNVSLAESQSISSLELGMFDGAGHSGESKSSLSRQGSIPSLDLKVVCVGSTDNGDEFGDSQSADFNATVTPSYLVETKPSCHNSTVPPPPMLNVSLVDRYSVIRSEQVLNEDPHISNWVQCIESSLNILQNATKIFNQMSCSTICNEVLGTEEGKNYVKNVIEVYKVVCRVALASKSYEKLNSKLLKLIDDADQYFNTLAVFLAGSSLLVENHLLDFSSGVLKPDTNNNDKACGVCLLDVDAYYKSVNRSEDVAKLIYGRRQYHCACANLWVNCVNPLLPVLTLPQLI